MQLSIQAALLNVRNLHRSVEFYQNVLGLRPTAREDRVAALMIDETNRRQVLVVREVEGANPVHMGRGSIGPRLLALEAGTLDELEVIEHRLTERHAFIGRRVRREALLIRVEVRDLHRLAVAAGRWSCGQPDPGGAGEGGKRP
jgi:catechol 2,3-dioxygenase-like lactoylglutathione lyase family enzyme